MFETPFPRRRKWNINARARHQATEASLTWSFLYLGVQDPCNFERVDHQIPCRRFITLFIIKRDTKKIRWTFVLFFRFSFLCRSFLLVSGFSRRRKKIERLPHGISRFFVTKVTHEALAH